MNRKITKMKRIYFIIALLLGLKSFAQQDPLFTQYMFNKLVVNPAYAGSNEHLSIDLLNRIQWVGIDGAPKTLTIGAHTAMRDGKVGLGVYGYRDALGATINQGFMATYAYRLTLSRGILSFGLQGGFKHFNFDWNAIRVKDPDLMFYPQEIERFTPDANFGIYYQSDRLFAGFSSKQLFENEYGTTFLNGQYAFSKLLRHFYLMTGAAIPFDEKIIFRPSLMAKLVKNAPLQVDINASVLFSDIFWIGASFRTEKAIAFLTEFRISPIMRLGYSYDIYLNELQPHNFGSHEFRLGFDVQVFNRRMRTPRFF